MVCSQRYASENAAQRTTCPVFVEFGCARRAACVSGMSARCVRTPCPGGCVRLFAGRGRAVSRRRKP
eukprot:8338167-Alexandrium_andersonii.AAC.1